MNILIEGRNLEDYYSKEHESFKNGLRALYSAKCYGEGYPEYDETISSFVGIKERMFGEEEIDLLITWSTNLIKGVPYSDLDKLNCKKAIMLCDFWSEAEVDRNAFFTFVVDNHIDYIICLFRYPFHIWEGYPEIHKRLIWLPPSFMPDIFNDWGNEKQYDVGNLNDGVQVFSSFYPERWKMHQKLIKMQDEGFIKYLHAKHPGAGFHHNDTPLIGKRFSEAINKCKIFVTSGNLTYKNFTSKYVEVMASKTALFTTNCLDEQLIGLVDGVNCVVINDDNFEEKIKYYLGNEKELKIITENGYMLAMERYTCFSQAAYFYRELREKEAEIC